MDLTPLKELGTLPFATLTAGMLWQVLGPTAKYLGVKGQELTQKAVDNIERIFTDAYQKLSDAQRDSGEVPPRVLRAVINEGAFTEDQIAGAYLGGVLASSKADSPRDDRGVVMNALISRLSVFQLRLHYVTYMALHYLLQGTRCRLGDDEIYTSLDFGLNGLMLAMGFSANELEDPEFDLDSAMTHALYGLDKEDLITNWQFNWKNGLRCNPTPIGVELFLWANGKGRKNLDYFFHREFEPHENSDDNISIVPGRRVPAVLDNGEPITINGFDYSFAEATNIACEIESAEEEQPSESV